MGANDSYEDDLVAKVGRWVVVVVVVVVVVDVDVVVGIGNVKTDGVEYGW